ncbi:MAG: transporter [Bacteroidia bacterium]|nr:transporter [Bacteroidia bacterium]
MRPLTFFLLLLPCFLMAQITSRLELYDLETGTRSVLHTAPQRFEAPNWSRDGSYLVFNQGGLLYRMPVAGGTPEEIPTGFARANNNDHGFSPDGSWLAISHHNGPEPTGDNSTVYIVPSAGGTPRQVTPLAPSYWHGWSPDGRTLAYVGRRDGEYDIYAISVEGGAETRLTRSPGLDDGPDYSPDGRYLYFNSVRSGSMQLWRMRADGRKPQQLTDDEFNNWFPHPSPDGRQLLFITYLDPIDPSTHPPDKRVALRLMDLRTRSIRTLCEFTGGQGSLNVPSWSPDGKRFAFVSYEVR